MCVRVNRAQPLEFESPGFRWERPSGDFFFLHAIAYLAATAEMVGWGKRGGGLLIGSGFIWRFHFLVFRPLSHAACCPSTFRCHLSVMESRLESLSASFPTLGRHVGDVANTADSSAPRWRKGVAVKFELGRAK